MVMDYVIWPVAIWIYVWNTILDTC